MNIRKLDVVWDRGIGEARFAGKLLPWIHSEAVVTIAGTVCKTYIPKCKILATIYSVLFTKKPGKVHGHLCH